MNSIYQAVISREKCISEPDAAVQIWTHDLMKTKQGRNHFNTNTASRYKKKTTYRSTVVRYFKIGKPGSSDY